MGLVDKVAYPPISFLMFPSRLAIFSIRFFFDKVRRPTTFPFGKIFEDSALLLGVPFDCIMAPMFFLGGGVPKWSGETCGRSPRNLV